MGDGNKTDEVETDVPFAPGLDEVWHANNTVDVAEREKQAIAAEDFQAHRAARYLESGGADQVGGWLGLSPSGYGARGIFHQRGRQIDWR
jgi:hypothetical protein